MDIDNYGWEPRRFSGAKLSTDPNPDKGIESENAPLKFFPQNFMVGYGSAHTNTHQEKLRLLSVM